MRLPPAEMMYSATWRTRTTSECSRARTTASTALMSASIEAYKLAKFTADVKCCGKGAMLGGASAGVNGTTTRNQRHDHSPGPGLTLRSNPFPEYSLSRNLEQGPELRPLPAADRQAFCGTCGDILLFRPKNQKPATGTSRMRPRSRKERLLPYRQRRFFETTGPPVTASPCIQSGSQFHQVPPPVQ